MDEVVVERITADNDKDLNTAIVSFFMYRTPFIQVSHLFGPTLKKNRIYLKKKDLVLFAKLGQHVCPNFAQGENRLGSISPPPPFDE